jgi:hypothetical protein
MITDEFFEQITEIINSENAIKPNDIFHGKFGKLAQSDLVLMIRCNNATDEKRVSHDFHFNNINAETGVSFSLSIRSTQPIARFSLAQLHGCCGVCVSYHSMVYPPFRNIGVGSVLNKMRFEIAKYLGYGILMCTDVVANLPQRKILENNGWEEVHRFINPRTDNKVSIHVINLGNPSNPDKID